MVDLSLVSDKGTAISEKAKPFRLKTAVHTFDIPAEIALEFGKIGVYAETIEFCVRNRYESAEFLQYCQDRGIPVEEKEFHIALYDQLRELDANNQNGVWARIIKNAFAPLFVGEMDYVAGNPPWVNWEHLPEGYRDDMKPLWTDYGLFTLTGHAARLGGGKKDLAIIFTYAAADAYLAKKGRLGFVITQSVFKTQGAGDGFRRFRFERNGQKCYLKPLRVHDLSAMQVFEGATNRTAIFICEKNQKPFKYPVPYTVWTGPSRIGQDVSLDEARSLVFASEIGAAPVDPKKPTSPWLTAPKQALSGIRKVIGKSGYQAYAGCCTWLNAVYWIRVLDKRRNGDLLIENLHDGGKIKVQQVQTVIEPDLVYPLLRGRDVKRWRAEPSVHIILAQDPETRTGIPETEMKLRYPKTFAYLRQFEGDPNNPERGTLRGRSGYKQYFKPTDPFYSMYNVGPYTMAEWKVVWREQSAFFQAALSGTVAGKTPLPDHKLMMVPCHNEQEAHFLLGALNSSPSILAITSYAISTSTSTHVLSNVAIPAFSKSSKIHNHLAGLSLECHSAAHEGDADRVKALEAEIDELAASLWGITAAELKAIRKILPGT